MNHGAKGTSVFQSDELCDCFCEMPAEVAARFNLRVLRFALMPTHYHLLIESVQQENPGGHLFAWASILKEMTDKVANQSTWVNPVPQCRHGKTTTPNNSSRST